MFERGKIILVPFPFTNLSASKVRPALIISDPRHTDEDVSVLFITSRLVKKKSPMDYGLEPSDSHFQQTGLKVASLIKCNKVATLDKKIVLGELGSLHPANQKEIDKRIKLAFGL